MMTMKRNLSREVSRSRSRGKGVSVPYADKERDNRSHAESGVNTHPLAEILVGSMFVCLCPPFEPDVCRALD